MVDHIDPVQFTIRLLIPPGSLLLSRPGIRPFLGRLDPAGFTYRWTHPDPRMDVLQRELSTLVEAGARSSEEPAAAFGRIRALPHPRPGRPHGAGPIRAPPPERPLPCRPPR